MRGEHMDKPGVLIVESNPGFRSLMSKLIRSCGYSVAEADSIESSIVKHRQTRFELVVLGTSLGGGTPQDLRLSLARNATPFTYFLEICEAGEVGHRMEGGADDVIPLPLDPGLMRARLALGTRMLACMAACCERSEELERLSDSLSYSNENLQYALRRFEILFNQVPVACFTFDAEGLVHEWNRAAEQAFGIPGHKVVQRPLWEVFGQSFWSRRLVESTLKGTKVEEAEWSLDRAGGERSFIGTIDPLYNQMGEVVGAISANSDISEMRQAKERIDQLLGQVTSYAGDLARQKSVLEIANAQLNHMVGTDGLTGLMNHRHFQDELTRALKSTTTNPVSVIIFDVDSFKSYNDEFGHAAGDDVLLSVARIAVRIVGTRGQVARYGGEEFAVILPDCDCERASVCAEEMRAALERAPWMFRTVTASFGVASHLGERTPRELVVRADRAMYAAKHAGRNCVRIDQDPRAESLAA